MSATTSATTGRRYGLERVCRTWERSRSALYARRARVRRPERGDGPGRRGPTPALSDAQLLAAIRSDLVRSPFQGEGHRKVHARLRIRRGGITKTGNAHLRRIVIEAAWAYRHRPARGRALLKRQQPVSEEVKAIAWKAQHRLHSRYRTLTARGKSKQQVVTAVGRELLGFIWAIGTTVEAEAGRTRPVAA